MTLVGRRGSGGHVESMGRPPAQQLKYNMDVWQKWTQMVNLGARHTGEGPGSMSAGARSIMRGKTV